MPLSLALLFLVQGPSVSISLNELDIFNLSGFRVFRFDDGYLFQGYLDPALVLYRSGEIVADYRKAGVGPGELTYPRVLHVGEKSFLVLTNQRHIVAFDSSLKPDPDRYPPLPIEWASKLIYRAIDLGDGKFLFLEIPTGFHVTHLMHLAVLEGGEWHVLSAHFPHRPPPAVAPAMQEHYVRFNRYFSDLYFNFPQSAVLGQGPYEVDVLAPLGAEKDPPLIQVLRGNVDDLKSPMDPKVHCFINNAFPTKEGYAVLLGVSLTEAYFDFFARDGQFLRRVDRTFDLFPVENGGGIFVWHHDSEVLSLSEF